MLTRVGPATIAIAYAVIASAWIVFSGYAVNAFAFDAIFRERIELLKGLAFVIATSALLYLLLRARLKSAKGGAADEGAANERRFTIPLVVGLALGIPVLGVSVYLLQSLEDEAEELESLGAIAELKAGQIENWIAERRGDALELQSSAGFIGNAKALQGGAVDERARAGVRTRLKALHELKGFKAIRLFGADGQLLLAVGEPHGGSELLAATEIEPADGTEVRMGELYRDPAGENHLEFLVPLAQAGPQGLERVGVVSLHVNPEDFLFPAIRKWPAASVSGESYIVRRDGGDVVFLSGQRFREGPGPEKPLSVNARNVLAAMALRADKAGAAKAIDYRGVEVLGAWRPVAGTDWRVVAKVDLHEALDETRETAWWVSAVIFLSTLVVGVALFAYLRQSQRSRELALQSESDRLYRHFYQLPFVGMAITSPATKQWVRFNDRLCEILGYSREELAGKSWAGMTHPDDVDKDVAQFDRVMRGESEGYAMEKRFLRKDGAVAFAEIDVKCVRKADGTVDYFVATVRDITERTLDRQKILRQSRFYAGLSDCNAAIAQCRTEDELFSTVCRVAVESAGVKVAWVGLADAQGMVRPHASFGGGEEYLKDLRVSVRADDPYGQGPTGTSIRENRPYWCDDFRNDPRTAPWHERAARFGWGSSASLPIRRANRAIGAFTIYSGEVRAFDDDARRLLLDMTSNISFALDHIDREAARLRAEEELRISEERYRLLFSRSLDAILLTQPEGRVLAANEAACRMFQMSEEELVRADRARLVDTTDPRVTEAIATRDRTGEFSGEMTLIRADGTTFDAEVSSGVFRDSSGTPRSSMIIRDVSERKRTETRLREQLDELRRWTAVTLDREERIIDLKREVNELLKQAGQPPRYASGDADGPERS